MKLKQTTKIIAGLSLLSMAAAAHGAVITFTGGTGSGTSSIYQEAGFQVQSIGGDAFFGDYYGVGNDVVHAHWDTGGINTVTAIEITKIGGGTFDLNYFVLTSNTDTGGWIASGNEMAWIRALDATDTQIGAAVLLTPENWGFPATQIFLGADFDAVTKAQFYVTNEVDCFGMDEFYIDEAAPPSTSVPDGGATVALLGFSLMGLFRMKQSSRK